MCAAFAKLSMPSPPTNVLTTSATSAIASLHQHEKYSGTRTARVAIPTCSLYDGIHETSEVVSDSILLGKIF